ncbi:MAG: 3-oxoacyl-ACP reductase family protein [Bryobacteraceae bacterium]|jgi:NAD(P)-dependent dehydrogenase (short-subunit alcohol dehydrogenase family)
MTLEGLTAVVTGASRGIGKAIALELARAGCRVAVNYLDDPVGAAGVVAGIRELGREAFAVQADVGAPAEVQRMFREVKRVDILVNNAAVQTAKPLLEVTDDEWDRVIRTNLTGCFLCTRSAGRLMKEHGGGVIVNIGSGCCKVPFPGLVAYTASKGGIDMFTKVAAIELGLYGIRVNCVAPGAIEVERTLADDPDFAKTWAAVTPLGRIGTPADVAGAVVFLASPAASFITGQTLWVDGAAFTKPQWPY